MLLAALFLDRPRKHVRPVRDALNHAADDILAMTFLGKRVLMRAEHVEDESAVLAPARTINS